MWVRQNVTALRCTPAGVVKVANLCSLTARSVPGPASPHRLVGLEVKASASRAEGPGFESRLRRDFFGVESYQ